VSAEQVTEPARQAIHFSKSTVFPLREIDRAFLHFAIGELEDESGQYFVSKALLNTTIKKVHCLFDIEWLRFAVQAGKK
jgi:hypothetical protein